MKLQDRNVKTIKIIREIYTYDNLEEREDHLAEMQFNDWQVTRTDRRKEKGYLAIFLKEEPIK